MDKNVIADFRGRKIIGWYDEKDNNVPLKIIPLQTTELKQIIVNKLKYKNLYNIFETAYQSSELAPSWYKNNLVDRI